MSLQIRWLASVPAGLIYLVDGLFYGRVPSDPRLPGPLLDEAGEMLRAMEESFPNPGAVLSHWVPLSANPDSPRQILSLALYKGTGVHGDHSPAGESIFSRITELQRRYQNHFPNLLEELQLRWEPLRDQWEARGPGLWGRMEQLLELEVLASEAEVVLVQPLFGGGGKSCLVYNRVVFEAVSADPIPELPEVARLAWFLSRLQLDVPRVSERVPVELMDEVFRLATLPAALAAAAEVELVQPGIGTLELALEKWLAYPALSGHPEAARRAELLYRWWDTYLQSPPRFSVAIQALAEMLQQEAEEG